MITAQEAKQKTDQLIENALKVEMKFLEETINSNIKKHEYHFTLTDLSKRAKQELETLGFRVTELEDDGEPYFQISWS